MKKRPSIHFAIMFIGMGALCRAQPIVTQQPGDQSVSLGATVKFLVSATSSNRPIFIQWQFTEASLPMATNASLTLTNIQIVNGGDYRAVLTDGSGSVTSRVAHLEVDPTFTSIVSSPVVNDAGSWAGCAWGDYDNDGLIDLFITSTSDASGTPQRNALYHNNGDGTFARVSGGTIVSDSGDWRGCAWGDYDNDGQLDLFVTRVDTTGYPTQAVLYRNIGGGAFIKMSSSVLGHVATGGFAEECVWADYDKDGFIDMFVARNSGADWLLHNNGDGTLSRVINNVGILEDDQNSYGAMWGDFNGDGWPDLIVPVWADSQTNQENHLYLNNGNGTFTRITMGSIVSDSEHSVGCTWVDYDNDGNLDLFVVNGVGVSATNSLYRNNGNGTFTKMTTADVGSIVGDVASFASSTWGDYDNDGFIDVFVANLGNGVSYLYHNNGNGTFTRVLSGSPSNDTGPAFGCAWGDYDNDGFLDLIVTRGAHDSGNNLLYRNSTNGNGWMKLNLVGTVSNRSAIGAKVSVKATISGQTVWQLREITAGNGFASGPFVTHFGLGDATNVSLVRIEWPSGVVQTMTNLAVKQFLTVVERQSHGMTASPALTGIARSQNGTVTLSVTGGTDLLYLFEASTNVVDWTWLGVRTNLTGTVEYIDNRASNFLRRFYRVSIP